MKAKLKDVDLHQPAIDAFTLDMMRHFNKLLPPSPPPQSRRSSWAWLGSPSPRQENTDTNTTAPEGVQPLVYATYQAYLRR